MNFEFKYAITREEIEQIFSFCSSIDSVAIEQQPAFASLVSPDARLCYFWCREDDKIIAFAIVRERRKMIFSSADIMFGPIFNEEADLVKAIEALRDYYSRKKFMMLTVQLGIPVSNKTELLEYRLNQELRVQYRFDRYNWSSIIVDLLRPEDDILRSFSKGHKSDVKKALKSGLVVEECASEEDLRAFIEVYIRMHRERKISIDEQFTRSSVLELGRRLAELNSGFILLVKNPEYVVIGGIIVVFQGSTARYYKGAAESSMRQYPVLHLAIWEAMKKSRAAGRKTFDLWGYNHFVKEDDQIFFINRFKKGFGGEFTFFPKRMYFLFQPLKLRMYENGKYLIKRSNR